MAHSSEIERNKTLLAELWNLHTTARTALAGSPKPDTWYERALLACRWFSEAHPEFSANAAYKVLDHTRNR